MQSKYGISVEQYKAMLADQGGTCALCPTAPTDRRALAVDHDHETGKVRALLCHTCNNHLGIFERRRAEFAAYVARFQCPKD